MGEASEEFVIPPTDPEDASCCIFTSGKQGCPKGFACPRKRSIIILLKEMFWIFNEGIIFLVYLQDPVGLQAPRYGTSLLWLTASPVIVDETEFGWIEVVFHFGKNKNQRFWYNRTDAIRRLMRIGDCAQRKIRLSFKMVLSVGEPLPSGACPIWGNTKAFGVPNPENWCKTRNRRDHDWPY